MSAKMKKRIAKATRKDAELADCLIPISDMVNDSNILSQSNKFADSKKGKAQVDSFKTNAAMFTVYEDASGNQFSAYLNKSDLGKNNNKFYLI